MQKRGKDRGRIWLTSSPWVLILLLLAGVLRLCRPLPRLRYAFAVIAMLAMPIAFGVTVGLSFPVNFTRMAPVLRAAPSPASTWSSWAPGPALLPAT